jgi:hypothetical protein
MPYWIFKCNPAKYRLPDRLEDPDDATTWTVAQHKTEIRPGDIAFLWVTGDERGIRAVLRVDDAPRVRPEIANEQTYWVERETQDRMRVACTIIKREVNLRADALRPFEGLQGLSVFHGFQQATNFPVTNAEGEILMRLAGCALETAR